MGTRLSFVRSFEKFGTGIAKSRPQIKQDRQDRKGQDRQDICSLVFFIANVQDTSCLSCPLGPCLSCFYLRALVLAIPISKPAYPLNESMALIMFASVISSAPSNFLPFLSFLLIITTEGVPSTFSCLTRCSKYLVPIWISA